VQKERDYVLGTHDEELERLGLQHRVWRPHVLECWAREGITIGKRVLDVGAGPGYATIDLAEIVGPTGSVTAVERSHNFILALQRAVEIRGLTNVRAHELDLMLDPLPSGDFDFSWCRWVAAFTSDPGILVKKLKSALRPGGVAIFHEYGHYETWRFYPGFPSHGTFRDHVVKTWRESGGEPDAARIILSLLKENDFALRSVRPLIFAVSPKHYMWRWAATFVDVYVPRLQEMGRIDQRFANTIRNELAEAERDPDRIMVTPLVLEIVAEKR
jgi:SAM-dependent methyltransferase